MDATTIKKGSKRRRLNFACDYSHRNNAGRAKKSGATSSVPPATPASSPASSAAPQTSAAPESQSSAAQPEPSPAPRAQPRQDISTTTGPRLSRATNTRPRLVGAGDATTAARQHPDPQVRLGRPKKSSALEQK
ncbi:unnamed protein product [Parascedosporium putredinis]|uniref:Uncharacterized protein n=1 Tax=Parascedosporium putredinis TaxID=1442378 RepID=A0A9P1HBT4_9PEZI|nr:unnamed protein product [Parascedosporium putredinis]CAI8004191.1 unnamed protein product [Parascedosporium putredinis]